MREGLIRPVLGLTPCGALAEPTFKFAFLRIGEFLETTPQIAVFQQPVSRLRQKASDPGRNILRLKPTRIHAQKTQLYLSEKTRAALLAIEMSFRRTPGRRKIINHGKTDGTMTDLRHTSTGFIDDHLLEIHGIHLLEIVSGHLIRTEVFNLSHWCKLRVTVR